MLEVGKTYTSEEVARDVFNVSKKTFSNRRAEYLEKMKKYYS